MRSLTITVVALALAWSAFWFYSANAEESAVDAWFAARGGSTYTSIATQGFPSRLDTSIEAPSFDLGPVTWSLPLMQLLRLSYTPGQYTLAFDTPHVFVVGDQTLTLATGAARASAVYDGDTLERLILTVETPRLISDTGWSLTAPRLLFATRRSGEGYEVGFDAVRLSHAGHVTDLHAIGSFVVADGVPVGEIPVSTSDPVAFGHIAAAIGWPKAEPPLSLTFREGNIYLNNIPLGRAPHFP